MQHMQPAQQQDTSRLAQESTAYDPDPRHAGMPTLDGTAGDISWFEFASPRWFYLPVYAYCAWLSLRYLGLRHPTNANPAIPFSGLVGESKSEVLSCVRAPSNALTARFIKVHRAEGGSEAAYSEALAGMQAARLTFPAVVKPDLGMRGAGVQVAKSEDALRAYIDAFPAGADFLVQELVDYEGEAGVFYVRHPDWEKGKIISLTLKYFPRVYGDGTKTLRELIMADPRAGKVPHLYTERFKDRLDTKLSDGESVRLAFAGNHCQGTIFRNGNDHITDAMVDTFDAIARDMGEFYIGRFDVRFDTFEGLKRGEGFKIIEVNGAGGESTHIWDARTRLRDAYKTLMRQFRHIYEIGAKNRRRGFRPPTLQDFIKAWQREKTLTGDYPSTH